MKKIVEIGFHGRGGQGAKTASMMLGEAALEAGKYIQAFPEYGPERTGAPVKAFNRISDSEIRKHSGVVSPDAVVVIDPTLVDAVDVMEGLAENGSIIINSEKTPEEMAERLNPGPGQTVHTVDATRIALDTLGRSITNMPMLGALLKITSVVDLEVLKEKIRHHFEGKLSSVAVEGNLDGIKRAYEEVK